MIKASPHTTQSPISKTKYANVYITTDLGLSVFFFNLSMEKTCFPCSRNKK